MSTEYFVNRRQFRDFIHHQGKGRIAKVRLPISLYKADDFATVENQRVIEVPVSVSRIHSVAKSLFPPRGEKDACIKVTVDRESLVLG